MRKSYVVQYKKKKSTKKGREGRLALISDMFLTRGELREANRFGASTRHGNEDTIFLQHRSRN
jgi:hypothetical protein